MGHWIRGLTFRVVFCFLYIYSVQLCKNRSWIKTYMSINVNIYRRSYLLMWAEFGITFMVDKSFKSKV